MGAHVDHQYGLVSGFAIDKGITLSYVPTDDGSVKLCSVNFAGEQTFSVCKTPKKQGDWADYLRGAAWALARRYELRFGLDAVIEGTLPVGGLSSSAAVILAFLTALCRINSVKLSRAELIDVALDAERLFVGVHVGKLDQSCEVYSKKDCLLYLDTKSDSYELIPRNESAPPFEIAIFFSGVERTLAGSPFNVRVDELKAASYALKGFAGMEYGSFENSRLRDVPVEVFEKHRDKLPENWLKRATHYYSEVERVRRGAEAWRRGDLKRFGELIFESGHSSIFFYETGSDELKRLYE
ncbi:MAG: GHMP kinase, partial [Thermoguttaceae bacterium]|nr:GHMP kinase [Thermoguttaceae bacterium]